MPENPDDWPEQLQAAVRRLIERYGFYEFEEVAGEIIALESKRREAENEALWAARAAALEPFLQDIGRIMGPAPANPGARTGGGWTEGRAWGLRKHRLEEFIVEHGHLPSED